MARYAVFMPRVYESLDEAAKRAGVHRRTINRWIADGTLPSYHQRGARTATVVRIADVKQLMKPTLRHAATTPKRGVSSPSANTG